MRVTGGNALQISAFVVPEAAIDDLPRVIQRASRAKTVANPLALRRPKRSPGQA